MNNLFIVKENIQLKEKIKLYETSTHLDCEKIKRLENDISNLNEKIFFLKNIIENKKYID